MGIVYTYRVDICVLRIREYGFVCMFEVLKIVGLYVSNFKGNFVIKMCRMLGFVYDIHGCRIFMYDVHEWRVLGSVIGLINVC